MICTKSKKYWFMLLALFWLSLSGLLSKNANAFSFGSTGRIINEAGSPYSWITVYNGNTSGQGAGPTYNVFLNRSADLRFLTANTNSVVGNEPGNLTDVHLGLNDTLPANSLFTISVRYLTANYAHAVEYRYAQSGDRRWTLLNSECLQTAEMDNTSNNSTFSSGITCTYWGYASEALTYISINTSAYFDVPLIVQTSYYTSYTRIITESGGGSSSGLTPEDKTWLQSQIQQVINSNNTGNQALENVADEIEEMNQRAVEERQEMEDNQAELEDTTEQVQQDVEDSTSSLTETMGQVVNTIKNAQPTNCNVTVNPRADQFELGTLNMCNAPASVRNTIQTVVVIAVTLGVFRVAYSIFNQIMYLIRREQQ